MKEDAVGNIEFSYAEKGLKGSPDKEKGLGKSMEREIFHVLRYGKVGSVSESSIIRLLSRYGNYRNKNLRMPMDFGFFHPKSGSDKNKKNNKPGIERA